MDMLADLPVIPWQDTGPWDDMRTVFTRQYNPEENAYTISVNRWEAKLRFSGSFLEDADPRWVKRVGCRVLILTTDEWALYRLVGRDVIGYLFYADRVRSGRHDRHLTAAVRDLEAVG